MKKCFIVFQNVSECFKPSILLHISLNSVLRVCPLNSLLVQIKKSCRNNSSSIIYMQMCDFSLHFHLPLEDLLEVVCLRVAYVSLGGFVVSLGDIVSDIVVVVLRCTCIDVHDSRRNLSCFRILKI